MREISGNTRSVDDIVQSELIDERASLEEEGQRLKTRVVSCAADGQNVMGTNVYSFNSPVQCRQRHQQQLLNRQLAIFFFVRNTSPSFPAVSMMLQASRGRRREAQSWQAETSPSAGFARGIDR